jgi:hypothetical protein
VRAGRPGFDFGQDRIFSLGHNVQAGSATRPAYPMATGLLCSGVKRPGRETDHSSTIVPTNLKPMVGQRVLLSGISPLPWKSELPDRAHSGMFYTIFLIKLSVTHYV